MSMSPKIIKHYLRLPIGHDIWDALAKVFYDGSHESQVFYLNQIAFSAEKKKMEEHSLYIIES